jgi:hypothetical protein
MSKDRIKNQLKAFILEKVKASITPEKPFYFLRWTGLYELCKAHGIDLVKLIDEMHKEGLIKKALIKGKLAITLPDIETSKKTNKIFKEFEEFVKRA